MAAADKVKNFEAAFAALKLLFAAYRSRLHVIADTEKEYTLVTQSASN